MKQDYKKTTYACFISRDLCSGRRIAGGVSQPDY